MLIPFIVNLSWDEPTLMTINTKRSVAFRLQFKIFNY